MEVKSFSIEYKEKLIRLGIIHNGVTYNINFNYSEEDNSMFGSTESKKYAWPKEEIPDELKFESGDEATTQLLDFSRAIPDDVYLIDKNPKEYDDFNNKRHPFLS